MESLHRTILATVIAGCVLGVIGWVAVEIVHDIKAAAKERQEIKERLSRLEGAMWGDSSRGGVIHR